MSNIPQKEIDKKAQAKTRQICKEIKWFIRSRRFIRPLIFFLVLLLANILFYLFRCGFRITYAPELENNWDAISGCAAWAGAIGTVAAVFSAIYVANRQNKIALFNKRYEVYSTLLRCISFANSIEGIEKSDIKRIRQLFIVSFSYKAIFQDVTEEKIYSECIQYALDTWKTLDTVPLLFRRNVGNYTLPIIKKLFALLFPKADSPSIGQCCIEYQAAVKKMEKDLLPEIKHQLSLV